MGKSLRRTEKGLNVFRAEEYGAPYGYSYVLVRSATAMVRKGGVRSTPGARRSAVVSTDPGLISYWPGPFGLSTQDTVTKFVGSNVLKAQAIE